MDIFTTEEVLLDLNDSITETILSSSQLTTVAFAGFESTPDDGSVSIENISRVTEDSNGVWAVYNLPSITFLILNSVVGLFGNSVVIYIYHFCLKATPMNSFVVSLAVLDIVTCSVAMPLMVLHDMLPYLFVSNLTCKILHLIYSSTIIASGLTLVAIAIDRYLRICRPLSNHLSVTQVKIITILLAAVSTLTCIPTIIMAGARTQRSAFVKLQRKYCYLKAEYVNSVYSDVFYSYKSTVILLTIVITVFCYFRIWYNSKVPTGVSDLREKRKSVRSASVQPKIKPSVKKMFMITLLFITSFLPSICIILVMMSMNVRDENLHPVAISFVNICRRTYLISCSLNPPICWYCNVTFRLRVKNIVSNWMASETSTNSTSEMQS